jgi:rhodanese-related sulfurtransferase
LPFQTERKEKEMKLKISAALMLLLGALLFAGVSGCAAVTEKLPREAPRIPLDELKSRLGDSSLVLIDVRTTGDWEESRTKIKGAIRENDYWNPSAWASRYPRDKTIVLYCA